MKQKFDLEFILLATVSIVCLVSFYGLSHAFEAAATVNSINGNYASNQNITRQAGNTTVTNSSGTIKIGIDGKNVATLAGTQTFTGSKTMNSLTLGGQADVNGKTIINVTAFNPAPGSVISIKQPRTTSNTNIYMYEPSNTAMTAISFIDPNFAERLYIQKNGLNNYLFTSKRETTGGALRDMVFQFQDASGNPIKTNASLTLQASDFSVKIGKLLNLTSNRIVNVATPIKKTDAQNANHLGLLGNLTTSNCSVNQTLIFQQSNSTWICGVPSTFPSNVNIGGNIASTASSGQFKITTAGAAICIGTCP